MQFPHIRNISSEWKICVFRGFCVRKKYQRENRNIFHTESTEPTELFLRNEQNMCYHTEIESTEFVADFVTTAGAVATDDEDDEERKSENGKVKTIHPLRFALPTCLRGTASMVWAQVGCD